MRHPRLPCALLLAIVYCGIAHAAPEKRVALLIGVGRYDNAPVLNNPVNDVQLMSPALRRLGFDVQVVTDPSYEMLRNAVREFGRRLDGAKVALFFYAGHGLQVAGRNYLLPTNATLKEERDLRYEAYDVQQVLDEMDAPGRVNLVFLDACRDNPLARSLASRMGNRSAAIGRGLGRIETQVSGTLIAYATAPGDVAADGDRNSPFTAALARYIATPGLDVRQMLTRVRADVQSATGGKQRPWVNESLDADFYFIPQVDQQGGAPVAPPAVPAVDVATPATPPAKGPPVVASPVPPGPNPTEPRIPRTLPDPTDLPGRMVGRWTSANSAKCSGANTGVVTVESGYIRFVWNRTNGPPNIAIERIVNISDTVLQTIVERDENTDAPEVGHRIRYSVSSNSWSSRNLTTGKSFTHHRCR